MEDSRLFKPLKLGNITLQHRVAMAPLTRFRSTVENVPTPIMAEYYGQRASVPGTLLISEATFISPAQAGYDRAPGIWSDEQVAAWKPIVDAVHSKGSFIFCQLWGHGRAAQHKVLERKGYKVRAPSAIPMTGETVDPVPLTEEEIQATIGEYAAAAKNAVAAGFDGVEIHGANGYLVDQFLQDVSNKRTDQWGGSIENRSRFAMAVASAIVAAVGAERTAIRLSPYSTFQDMLMADPVPQFTDVVSKLDTLNLAYVHVVESRVSGVDDNANPEQSIDFVFDHFRGPVVVAGGFKPEAARKLVDEKHADRDIVVAFGRYFISSPDLPYRIRKGIEFNKYDRPTFYDWTSVEGYTGQPFSAEFLAENPSVVKSKA